MRPSKFKSIVLVTTLALTLSGGSPALADWYPEFSRYQSVYIDPALSSSQVAPIEFQSKLETELDNLRSTTRVNTYVLAIEANEGPAGSKPLGIRGADKAIERWGSLKDFPHDNYALIVWERRADNPSKGGVGLNTSENIVRPEVLTILKTYMPRDPHGAILAIASGVALSQDSRPNPFAVVGLIVFVLVLVELIVVIADDFTKGGESPKEQWKKWQRANSNGQDILIEVTEDGVLDFCSPLDGEEFLGLKDDVNKFFLRFTTLLEAVTKVVEACLLAEARGNFRELSRILDSDHVVTYGKLPLDQTSVFHGFEDTKTYKGDELIEELDQISQRMIKEWSRIKECLNSANPVEILRQEIEKLSTDPAVASSIPPVSSSRVRHVSKENVFSRRLHVPVSSKTSSTSSAADSINRRGKTASFVYTVPLTGQEPPTVTSIVSWDEAESMPPPSTPSPDTSSSSIDYGSSGSDYSSSDYGSSGGEY